MANSFLDLPMPAGDGAGASVDVSAMGRQKTFVMGGSFKHATVSVEISNDGGTVFQPITTFSGGGQVVMDVAAEFMRTYVRGRSAEPFSADLDVGANSKGGEFIAVIPMPAGDGSGAPVDISALGALTTFVIGGSFRGCSITIEVSVDGTNYAPCVSFFEQGGVKSKEIIANWARAVVAGRAGNTFPFTPTGSMGATRDISQEVVAHNLAGAEHNADTIANIQAKVSDATLAVLGTAQVFTKSQSVLAVGLTSVTNSVAIDGSLGNNYALQVDENTTVENPSNVVSGQIINIALSQVAAFTAAWGTAWLFPNGDPVLTAVAGANDLVSGIVLITDGAGGTGLGNALSILANISQNHTK